MTIEACLSTCNLFVLLSSLFLLQSSLYINPLTSPPSKYTTSSYSSSPLIHPQHSSFFFFLFVISLYKKMQILSFKSDRSRALWTSCLASAFRTALACAIVGGITLFGPISIRRQITLPAFSYVTVIIIIVDATLGDTFRGCWYALYATIQGVCPAILCLWVLGPARLTMFVTSLLVAVSAFVVVVWPRNTHIIAKRIALGQIVLVYVIGYINGVNTERVMHPIHVATSTAIGVLACILALLFPVPVLACVQVTNYSY